MRAAGFDDLPPQGFWALDALARAEPPAGGGTGSTELASAMGVSKQAASRLVDTLVAAGYLDRHLRSSDRRRVDLVLTRRGRRAAAVLAAASGEMDRRLGQELGPAALARLTTLLARAGGRPGSGTAETD